MDAATPTTTAWLFPEVRTETKAEIRERARAIHSELAALECLPRLQEQAEENIETLKYFIEKGRKGKMDMNDWDGLARNVGELEDVLTPKDRREMRADNKAWAKLKYGWIGMKKGQLFRCKMHRKELAILEEQVKVEAEMLQTALANVPKIERRLEKLRAVGPIPEDIATRLNLTVDGHRPQPKEN